MYVILVNKDFKSFELSVSIDPRDFKLKTILSPYSKQIINENNIQNIPEIFFYKSIINPLYENDFKDFEFLTSSQPNHIHKEDIEKRFPDKNIVQMLITFLDGTFLDLPYFDSMSHKTQDNYFQSGYAINSQIFMSILIPKDLDINDEIYRIKGILQSLSKNARNNNEYLFSQEFTNQTEEEIQNNFMVPVDYKYITDLEYRDRVHTNY